MFHVESIVDYLKDGWSLSIPSGIDMEGSEGTFRAGGIFRAGYFSWAHPLDLEPQGIPEALRAAFGNLGSTFGTSKTIPGPKKIENLENGIFWDVKNPQCCSFSFFWVSRFFFKQRVPKTYSCVFVSFSSGL